MFCEGRFWNKPEYYYNPRQLLRRLSRFVYSPTQEAEVTLPWSAKILCRNRDDIGKALSHFGLYDLSLSEVMWRLTPSGKTVIDIGGNIGYFSQLLAHKVGKNGCVHIFEPNPDVQLLLNKNLRNFKNTIIHHEALSDRSGQAVIYKPKAYEQNSGLATLEQAQGKEGATVTLQTLDSFAIENPFLAKIDVEGHELSVLKGAQKTLQSVEHIVFEEHNTHSSGVVEYLMKLGFYIYYIKKTFTGVELSHFLEKPIPYEPPNYLATRWPEERIKTIFEQKKWSIYNT